VVAPGLGRLPTPSVVVRPGEVEVELPQVRPQLSLQQQLAVRRKLKKQRRISKRKATQLLGDSHNLVITYVVRYWEVSEPKRSSAQRFAFIQSAYAQALSGNAKRVKQIRTRLNRITLRNLTPGAVFGISYSVELSTRNPTRRLGATRPSATVTFQAQ